MGSWTAPIAKITMVWLTYSVPLENPGDWKHQKSVPTDPTVFCQIVDGKVTPKKSYNYYFQIQGQLGISGRKRVDFVVWTCNGMLVKRICANPDCSQDMALLLSKFYVDSFLPELFSRRVERVIPLYE